MMPDFDAGKDVHACTITGCEEAVPRDKLMCPRHWRMVPKPLQTAVYAAWHRLIEGDDRTAARAHVMACSAATRAVEGKIARRTPPPTLFQEESI